MSSFSRLYEDASPAEPVLNISGWIALACYAGCASLFVMVIVRGLRFLRRPREANMELLSQDEEEVVFE
ncbi:unnamed protein product [Effrenium voratum]|nr:unnamed protein product [Effrenium voratum]